MGNDNTIVKEVGARALTSNEAKAILPTYDNIKDQIKEIRESAIEPKQNNVDDFKKTPQRLNNIGIIGKRGAGKTSILRTLQSDGFGNKGDIYLPIIVPENMSNKSNIMETILGMFLEQVNNIEKRIETNSKLGREDTYVGFFKDCRFVKENPLRRSYEEVVKQFCFIQEDYRSILIKQYTNEKEYAKKSSELFNADNEFINRFKEFIHHILLESKKLTSEKEDKEPLIIIMIDDIDLSTSRCSEIVKVLLSYLCQPNIVTFISGDLDTFEEALTIDFLRKDDALDNGVSEIKIIDNQTIKMRKKELAYEYLKKVIPPIYRHNVKEWNLSARAKFTMGQNQPTLMELIESIIEDDVAIFTCDKSLDSDKREPLIPMFNLFSDTSRGLNNVYSVLYEICEKTNRISTIQEAKDIEVGLISYNDKKRIIDTIIASSEILNNNRKMIYKCISFEKEKVKINYNKMYEYAYNKLKIRDTIELYVCIDRKNRVKFIKEASALVVREVFTSGILIFFIEQIFNVDYLEEVNIMWRNYCIGIIIEILQIRYEIYEQYAYIFESHIKGDKLSIYGLNYIIEPILINTIYSKNIWVGMHIYDIDRNNCINISRKNNQTKNLFWEKCKIIYQGLHSCLKNDNNIINFINKYEDQEEDFTFIKQYRYKYDNSWIYKRLIRDSVIGHCGGYEYLEDIISNGILEQIKSMFDEENKVKIMKLDKMDDNSYSIVEKMHSIVDDGIISDLWLELKRSVLSIVIDKFNNGKNLLVKWDGINEKIIQRIEIHSHMSKEQEDIFHKLGEYLRNNNDKSEEKSKQEIPFDMYEKIYKECRRILISSEYMRHDNAIENLFNKLSEGYLDMDFNELEKKYLYIWAVYMQAKESNYEKYFNDYSISQKFFACIEKAKQQRGTKTEDEKISKFIGIDAEYISHLFDIKYERNQND